MYFFLSCYTFFVPSLFFITHVVVVVNVHSPHHTIVISLYIFSKIWTQWYEPKFLCVHTKIWWYMEWKWIYDDDDTHTHKKHYYDWLEQVSICEYFLYKDGNDTFFCICEYFLCLWKGFYLNFVDIQYTMVH